MMGDWQLPLWLSIGLAVFVGLIAVWQVPRIKVRLSSDYSKERAEPEGVSGFRHWGELLGILIFFLVSGILWNATLWTQKTYTMAGEYYLNLVNSLTIKEYEQSLPISYALKETLWQLGFAPLPTLVDIPVGQFNMGSEIGGPIEQPIHKVTISNAFSISQSEITFEQYDYYIWKMRQVSKKEKDEYLYPYDQTLGRSTRPVIYISWRDAQAYANWLSRQLDQQCRLPNETEWAYAAQAGAETGDSWISFKPNNFGLNNMYGSVWEWVQDPWHDNYVNAPDNNQVWVIDGDTSRRVLRGGSWDIKNDVAQRILSDLFDVISRTQPAADIQKELMGLAIQNIERSGSVYTTNMLDESQDLRSAVRRGKFLDYRNSNVGFRVVCSSS